MTTTLPTAAQTFTLENYGVTLPATVRYRRKEYNVLGRTSAPYTGTPMYHLQSRFERTASFSASVADCR